jgi:hypothetical protein
MTDMSFFLSEKVNKRLLITDQNYGASRLKLLR